MDKATTAFERERKLAVERKSNVVGLADIVAGRQDANNIDDPIDKPETLGGWEEPGPEEADDKTHEVSAKTGKVSAQTSQDKTKGS
ncbi:hypothetical protein QEZ47_01810 [Aminobacter anthyllidis]|uniref:hypothetical protein n=1 Tax=Aminobacter anthyllidis TaxID=1035067 RepID=UPI0024547039|nr:hypothetical protein [Aminobacter anthyllidis]MDH4984321.1 hypothetical protein [Aminobacter anthyllidis]